MAALNGIFCIKNKVILGATVCSPRLSFCCMSVPIRKLDYFAATAVSNRGITGGHYFCLSVLQ